MSSIFFLLGTVVTGNLCSANMFNFINKPFYNSKEQTMHPFLCDQVKQFGICISSCSGRHELCRTLDKDCLNIPTKCFVSIQLTKILSPSHFYGRILKYSTAKDPTRIEDWKSYNDLSEVIKSELKDVGSSLNNKIVHKSPIIGEMVMVETIEKELFRAIVLDIINGWFSVKVKVKLIDLGHTVEINSNNVFVLPSHLKEFRPVAIEIIISSIEPVGEGGNNNFNWPVKTTKFVGHLLEPIIVMNLEIVCKVVLILGTTLWIDWLLVKKCANCSHFACNLYKNPLSIPRELLEHNLAKVSSKLISKLIDLDKDVHVWEGYKTNDKPMNKLLMIKTPNIPLCLSEEQKIKIDVVKQIQWAHLSKDEIYTVCVVYIEGPKCILVQNFKFIDTLKALQKEINKAIVNNTVKQLTCPTVGTVCLAKSPEDNMYDRVVIKKIDDQVADIFHVDYGGTFKVNINSLLAIPLNFITKLPFQIIECNLSGFKEISQTNIINQFDNNLLQLTNTPMFCKVISFSTNTKLTGGNFYEIVLFNSDTNINITMANDFNVFVDNSQIKNILSLNYEYNEHNNDDSDEEFDEEDLQVQRDFLMSLLNSNKNLVQAPDSTSQDRAINKPIKLGQKNIKLDSLNASQDIVKNNNQIIEKNNCIKTEQKYCLNCNIKPVVPQCVWHQDEQWIYIKLNVLSIDNYNVSHTTDKIAINIKTNSVSYFFTAVLYAYIKYESLTCHVTFDGIQIKLEKLVQVKYKWPRLMKCAKKHKYIIYNTDYITERKDMVNFARMINMYKLKALNKPLNTMYYDNYTDSSSDDEEYLVFED